MAREFFAMIERRIENEIGAMGSVTLKEIETSALVLIAAVDDIAGEDVIAGTTCGFGDMANAATRVPNRCGEFLDLEQPFANPKRFDIEAVRLSVPDVCAERAMIGRGEHNVITFQMRAAHAR